MANNPHEHHPFMPWSPWAPADMGVPPYGVPMFVPPIPIWEQPPPPMNMWYSQYFANSPVFRDREVSLIFKTHTLMHVPLRTHVTHTPNGMLRGKILSLYYALIEVLKFNIHYCGSPSLSIP